MSRRAHTKFSTVGRTLWASPLFFVLLAGCERGDSGEIGGLQIWTPKEGDEVLTWDEMIAESRACNIDGIVYGGPTAYFELERKDGSTFLVRAPGDNWFEAENTFVEAIEENVKNCQVLPSITIT